VVFGKTSVTTTGDAPLYNYQSSTQKSDESVTMHKVTVQGLVSGELYFFRPASGFAQLGYTETVGPEINIVAGAGVKCGSQVSITKPIPTTDSNGSCTYINDFMRRDFNNNSDQVLKLQNFLNVTEQLDVDPTGVWDSKTEAGVIAFQEKYKQDILTPWGSDVKATGYVYIMTKQKINQIVCGSAVKVPAEQKIVTDYKAGEQERINGTTGNDVNAPQKEKDETPIIIGLDNKGGTTTDENVNTNSDNLAAVAASESSSTPTCSWLCINTISDVFSRALHWPPFSLGEIFGF
jgi:peptidoglycan hydrolase-like protein with peptidoglycan-binding domain